MEGEDPQVHRQLFDLHSARLDRGLAKGRAEFREEWPQAVDLDNQYFGSAKSPIVPIVVDDVDDVFKAPQTFGGLPKEFAEAQMYFCPRGEAGQNLIDCLRGLLQKAPGSESETVNPLQATKAQMTTVVDASRPWPGLFPFTEEQRQYFFGRDDEVDELFHCVKRDVITLLYSKSGLGKSSLLQAGLFPRLREGSFLPVYVRLNYTGAAGSLDRR